MLRKMEKTLHRLYSQSLDISESRSLQQRYQKYTRKYLDSLPRVQVARNPFNDELFTMTIDVFGLDGIWWDVNGPDPIIVQKSPQHLVTLGALDLAGHQPAESDSPLIQSIEPGPGRPYIVPRLLRTEGVSCVIHSLPINDNRYRAYLISYFTDVTPDNVEGHQPWLRADFKFRFQGQIMWDRREDALDFKLEPWLETRPPQVFWIDPDDPDLRLQSGLNECPYLHLKGTRSMQVIRHGRVNQLRSQQV